MIIFSSAYILSEQAAGRPLTHPRIGWQTYTRGLAASAASASSTATDSAADAPLRPDTYEYWQPTTMPAIWAVDLGAAYDVDYIGIAGHTIGSTGGSVEAFYSTDTVDWFSFTDTGSFLSSTGEQWTINGTARVAFDSSHTTGYLILDGTSGNYASTPHSAAIGITGNIALKGRHTPTSNTPAADMALQAKYVTTGNQRSYMAMLTTAGKLRLFYSLTGSTGIQADSTVAVGFTDGTTWSYKIERNATTGEIIFYTSTDGVTFTQLGTTVIGTAGALFNATSAPLEIGSYNNGTLSPFAGKIYYAEVRNLVSGIIVAKFDPLNDSSFATAPGDDSPIMILNDPIFARYWRTRITGTIAPQIAVVHIGEVLAMERAIYGGVSPPTLSRDTVLKNSLSRGGRFLGQNFRRNGVKSNVSFNNLTPSFVRDEFDLFVRSARRFPYFFAWRPLTYPREIAYAWTADDIVPSNMGKSNVMQVGWPLRGIGLGD